MLCHLNARQVLAAGMALITSASLPSCRPHGASPTTSKEVAVADKVGAAPKSFVQGLDKTPIYAISTALQDQINERINGMQRGEFVFLYNNCRYWAFNLVLTALDQDRCSGVAVFACDADSPSFGFKYKDERCGQASLSFIYENGKLKDVRDMNDRQPYPLRRNTHSEIGCVHIEGIMARVLGEKRTFLPIKGEQKGKVWLDAPTEVSSQDQQKAQSESIQIFRTLIPEIGYAVRRQTANDGTLLLKRVSEDFFSGELTLPGFEKPATFSFTKSGMEITSADYLLASRAGLTTRQLENWIDEIIRGVAIKSRSKQTAL